MFKDALRDIVEKTDGGLAGLLMDSSGIALETYATSEATTFDINNVGVEFGVVLGSIKKAAEMLEAGTTQEVAINTDKLVTIIRLLGDTYYLALTMKPDGNFGKGRYMMRTAAPKLLAELG
jgi:predicted regulator of Ras-like GTPase activity (Roadblock/LC7/MglB family)